MNNTTILGKVWLNGSSDFQQNVPMPTQQNISDTVSFLMDPAHMNYRNQFIDILVNRIGYEFVHYKRFNNPLARFKKSKLTYGNIVEEIAPAWVRAHSYRDDAETLLKVHRPQLGAVYHSQNRRDMYPITINYDELRSAFNDENGLNKLVASIMLAPYNADEYDEQGIMLNLTSLYEVNFGFYKIQVPAGATPRETGENFLSKAVAMAGRLTNPSAAYNADLTEYGFPEIPTFVAPDDELILITTYETYADLNVYTLANLFNVEKAEVPYRVVQVPYIPIPNAIAILTTTDFLQCYDTVYETTNFWNPETLNTTYYLHHWGCYSVSPFVPAVLFTSEQGTVFPTVTMAATSLNIATTDTLRPGGTAQLTLTLNGTLTSDPAGEVPEALEVKPDTASFAITATDADGAAVAINSRTFVDEYGVLHLQKSGIKAGDKVAISVKSYYINPDGPTPDNLTSSLEITVA